VSYTLTTRPTGPSPVRNPGIRAALTARAEANAHADRVAAIRQADRDAELRDALALIARIIGDGAYPVGVHRVGPWDDLSN
jgi:hypothetical protein